MAISKTESGWLVDIQPGGRTGPRIRKKFRTQGEAKAFEIHAKGQHLADPEWSPKKKDKRRLLNLVERWFELHGHQLKDGKKRLGKLKQIAAELGNPAGADFSAQDFADYRANRIAAGASANTVNHDHAYVRAVFAELIRMGDWTGQNPLRAVRAFKLSEKELSWLTAEQIQILLEQLDQSENPHVMLISKICLSTGARWGEGEGLLVNQVRAGAIHFSNTKSGKNRSVPITKELEREIKKHHKLYGEGQKIFGPSHSTFRDRLKKTGIQLPRGQASHVLRHTFASHFMMNGGNILSLQKILGHSSLTMTMRYAHLAPEHLEEARRLNPMAELKKIEERESIELAEIAKARLNDGQTAVKINLKEL